MHSYTSAKNDWMITMQADTRLNDSRVPPAFFCRKTRRRSHDTAILKSRIIYMIKNYLRKSIVYH